MCRAGSKSLGRVWASLARACEQSHAHARIAIVLINAANRSGCAACGKRWRRGHLTLTLPLDEDRLSGKSCLARHVCSDPVAPLWLFIAQEFELRRPHQMALAEVRIPSLLAAP